ncbi:GDSL esterase/lipase At1g71691-like [Phragmites australis]|uniref:GDSL esterase/lipase At1g71691-like n=1 Tax=Phragmites australis TaxID=29695 RepID=UPI002D79C4E0|nr:GDSL esterase/lipase At1g71691-like [Phragmites australis]
MAAAAATTFAATPQRLSGAYSILILLLMACGGATAQVFPPWNGTFPMGPGFGSAGGSGGAAGAGAAMGVPAMFVFGDSLTDNGNNNDLTSLAKANYLPYGIDFAGGPTGRFSNGYTMVDEIAQLLGLPLLPAHSEASGDAVLHGVNYASAAAGILDNTGQNFVGRIPFNQQIKNFEQTLDQISRKLGAGRLASSLARSIFYVGMGSNDYLNNYLMPNYNTRNEYNGDQYSTLLVQQYTKQLNSLYNLGARKFVIAGVGSMACIPNMRARSPQNMCSPDVDDLIIPFNNKVKAMVSSLNANRPRAKFIYVDNYAMISEVLRNPWSYGFSMIDRGCCGLGRNRGLITCLPFLRPCPNRNTYVFWDAFHPTERVNVLLGRAAFNGGTDVVYPMNIQQLAAWQP